MCPNILLVGPVVAGKSTIGRQLANAHHLEFKDCYHELVCHTGATIPLIFEIEGEEGFRRRESAMLDQLTTAKARVLATGGGAVLAEQNRRYLTGRGLVIYLYASIEQLLQRTSKDTNKPLLQTENPREKLQKLIDERDPLYREVADMTIQTEGRSVRSVVKEIQTRLKHSAES